MNRRGFFQVVAGAAVAPKVLPQDALGLWPGKVSTPINGALTTATIRAVESQIQVGIYGVNLRSEECSSMEKW